MKGKETGQKRIHRVGRVGQVRGGWRSMDEAWPPDGGRRVLNQTETNGVRETERKKFRHEPADLNPFFPRLINTGKCSCGVCVSVCVHVCERACLAGEVLVCVALNKDQKHSDITSAQPDSPLASQPLHMPLFNFGACNPIKA